MEFPRPFEDELLCSTLARYMLHYSLTNKDLASIMNSSGPLKYKLYDDCLFMFNFIADRLKAHLNCEQLFMGHTVVGRLLPRVNEDFTPYNRKIACKQFKNWAGRYYDYLTARRTVHIGRMLSERFTILRGLTNIDFKSIRYCPCCMKQRRRKLQDGYVKCSWQFLRYCPDCGNALEIAYSWGIVNMMEPCVKGIDAQGNDIWYGLQPLEVEKSGDKIINQNYLKLLKQLNSNACVLSL